jgi:dTDP-4-dehydrorhamnose 3,5-epimerase
VDEVISSGQNLQLVRVPGNFWHGFKAIGNEEAVLVYFTTNLYDAKDPDEERRTWNDSSLAPKSVNGNTDDPRVGKPWNWDYPPHR